MCVVMDIPAGDINIDNVKAIFRDQAWDELPAVMKPKRRPSFDTVTPYVLLPQTELRWIHRRINAEGAQEAGAEGTGLTGP